MLIQYYLAAQLGTVWFRLHPGLRSRVGDRPDLCRKAATDRQVAAIDLWKAQVFAISVWWRTAIAVSFLDLPVIGIAAALRPGRIGTDVVVAVLLIIGTVEPLRLLDSNLRGRCPDWAPRLCRARPLKQAPSRSRRQLLRCLPWSSEPGYCSSRVRSEALSQRAV